MYIHNYWDNTKLYDIYGDHYVFDTNDTVWELGTGKWLSGPDSASYLAATGVPLTREEIGTERYIEFVESLNIGDTSWNYVKLIPKTWSTDENLHPQLRLDSNGGPDWSQVSVRFSRLNNSIKNTIYEINNFEGRQGPTNGTNINSYNTGWPAAYPISNRTILTCAHFFTSLTTSTTSSPFNIWQYRYWYFLNKNGDLFKKTFKFAEQSWDLEEQWNFRDSRQFGDMFLLELEDNQTGFGESGIQPITSLAKLDDHADNPRFFEDENKILPFVTLDPQGRGNIVGIQSTDRNITLIGAEDMVYYPLSNYGKLFEGDSGSLTWCYSPSAGYIFLGGYNGLNGSQLSTPDASSSIYEIHRMITIGLRNHSTQGTVSETHPYPLNNGSYYPTVDIPTLISNPGDLKENVNAYHLGSEFVPKMNPISWECEVTDTLGNIVTTNIAETRQDIEDFYDHSEITEDPDQQFPNPHTVQISVNGNSAYSEELKEASYDNIVHTKIYCDYSYTLKSLDPNNVETIAPHYLKTDIEYQLPNTTDWILYDVVGDIIAVNKIIKHPMLVGDITARPQLFGTINTTLFVPGTKLRGVTNFVSDDFSYTTTVPIATVEEFRPPENIRIEVDPLEIFPGNQNIEVNIVWDDPEGGVNPAPRIRSDNLSGILFVIGEEYITVRYSDETTFLIDISPDVQPGFEFLASGNPFYGPYDGPKDTIIFNVTVLGEPSITLTGDSTEQDAPVGLNQNITIEAELGNYIGGDITATIYINGPENPVKTHSIENAEELPGNLYRLDYTVTQTDIDNDAVSWNYEITVTNNSGEVSDGNSGVIDQQPPEPETKSILAWATIDSYPYEGDTLPVAVVAVNEWDGINSVKFTFDKSVTINGNSVTEYTVTESTWEDVFGTGQSGEYWVAWVDIGTWATAANDVTVTSVVVTTQDSSTEYEMIDRIRTRVLRKMPVDPDTIYLDVNADVDDEDPNWAGAYTTIDAALNAAAASADQILIRPGEYPSVGKLRTSFSSSRDKFIVLRGVGEDVSIKSDASEWERRTIESWIGFEDIDFKMDSYVAGAAQYTNWTLTEDHLMFKNCNFTYAGTGENMGSIKTESAGPHISFMGCTMEGGNRGIVVSYSGSGENRDCILHNILFTNLGTTMRLQWSNTLAEYITSHGNLVDPSGWDSEEHFNMCNTGKPVAASGEPMEEVIYRGIRSYNNGSELKNYSFFQFIQYVNNVALLDSYSYVHQHLQQVVNVNSTCIANNMQFSGLIIGSVDDPLRGFVFQGTGDDILVRNIAATVLYPISSNSTWNIESVAAVYANDEAPSDYDSPDVIDLDEDMINGNALLEGLETGDPTPSEGSALIAAGTPNYRKFDINGEPWDPDELGDQNPPNIGCAATINVITHPIITLTDNSTCHIQETCPPVGEGETITLEAILENYIDGTITATINIDGVSRVDDDNAVLDGNGKYTLNYTVTQEDINADPLSWNYEITVTTPNFAPVSEIRFGTINTQTVERVPGLYEKVFYQAGKVDVNEELSSRSDWNPEINAGQYEITLHSDDFDTTTEINGDIIDWGPDGELSDINDLDDDEFRSHLTLLKDQWRDYLADDVRDKQALGMDMSNVDSYCSDPEIRHADNAFGYGLYLAALYQVAGGVPTNNELETNPYFSYDEDTKISSATSKANIFAEVWLEQMYYDLIDSTNLDLELETKLVHFNLPYRYSIPGLNIFNTSQTGLTRAQRKEFILDTYKTMSGELDTIQGLDHGILDRVYNLMGTFVDFFPAHYADQRDSWLAFIDAIDEFGTPGKNSFMGSGQFNSAFELNQQVCADWNREQSGKGELPAVPFYAPTDEEFADAAQVFQERGLDPSSQPIRIFRPQNADHVKTLLQWCVDNNNEFVVRCGGHSYILESTGNNINVIDVRDMNAVTLNTTTNLADVGAGAYLWQVDRAINCDESSNRQIQLGTCPHVGISGVISAGGLNPLQRQYGLICDTIEEITMVVADDGTGSGPKIITANAINEYSDIFEGIKGVGNSSLGIVTNWKLHTSERQITHKRTLQWDIENFSTSSDSDWVKSKNAFNAWQTTLSDLPDNIDSICSVMKRTGDLHRMHIAFKSMDGIAVVNDFVDTTFLPAVDIDPDTDATSDDVGSTSSFNCSNDYEDEDLFPYDTSWQLSKSAIPSSPVPIVENPDDPEYTTDVIYKVLDFYRTMGPTLTHGRLLCDALGGPIIEDGTGLIPWRSGMYTTQFYCDSPSEEIHQDVIDNMRTAYNSYKSDFDLGGYVGYVDSDIENPLEFYYGSNLPTFESLKSKYDPNDVFPYGPTYVGSDLTSKPYYDENDFFTINEPNESVTMIPLCVWIYLQEYIENNTNLNLQRFYQYGPDSAIFNYNNTNPAVHDTEIDKLNSQIFGFGTPYSKPPTDQNKIDWAIYRSYGQWAPSKDYNNIPRGDDDPDPPTITLTSNSTPDATPVGLSTTIRLQAELTNYSGWSITATIDIDGVSRVDDDNAVLNKETGVYTLEYEVTQDDINNNTSWSYEIELENNGVTVRSDLRMGRIGGESHILIPGGGWTEDLIADQVGESDEPGGDAKVIARWNMVTDQELENGETITVGVVAFHYNGIHKVEFYLDGPQNPSTVTEMTYNPSSKTWEYWAIVDANNNTDGRHEIRAIIYPKNNGIPRVLQGNIDLHPWEQNPSVEDELERREIKSNGNHSMHVWTNRDGDLETTTYYVDQHNDGSDTTGDGTEGSPYATINKAMSSHPSSDEAPFTDRVIIKLNGSEENIGKYTYGGPNEYQDPLATRWITLMPYDGVNRDHVQIFDNQPYGNNRSKFGNNIYRVRLYNLTLGSPDWVSQNGKAHGPHAIEFTGHRAFHWFDGCKHSTDDEWYQTKPYRSSLDYGFKTNASQGYFATNCTIGRSTNAMRAALLLTNTNHRMSARSIYGGPMGVNITHTEGWKPSYFGGFAAKAKMTVHADEGSSSNPAPGNTDELNGITFTLTDSDELMKTYKFSTRSDITNGDIDDDGSILIAINGLSNKKEYVVRETILAIEHANGHNGTILGYHSGSNFDVISLQQDRAGTAGNTPITVTYPTGTEDLFVLDYEFCGCGDDEDVCPEYDAVHGTDCINCCGQDPECEPGINCWDYDYWDGNRPGCCESFEFHGAVTPWQDTNNKGENRIAYNYDIRNWFNLGLEAEEQGGCEWNKLDNLAYINVSITCPHQHGVARSPFERNTNHLLVWYFTGHQQSWEFLKGSEYSAGEDCDLRHGRNISFRNNVMEKLIDGGVAFSLSDYRGPHVSALNNHFIRWVGDGIYTEDVPTQNPVTYTTGDLGWGDTDPDAYLHPIIGELTDILIDHADPLIPADAGGVERLDREIGAWARRRCNGNDDCDSGYECNGNDDCVPV